MKVSRIDIEGPIIIEPSIHEDERGCFFESYNQSKLKSIGINNIFIQDNESHSFYGVLRGMHYQTGKSSQAKLVRVIKGEVQDLIIDIRINSPTYGKTYSIILNEDNKKQLFVPRGFAHGFLVLSSSAIFAYKCDNIYNKESEANINPLSKNLNWVQNIKFNLSQKDKDAPLFGDQKSSEVFYEFT